MEGAGRGGLESGRFEIHTGEFGLHLVLRDGTPDGQAQKRSHGSVLAICCRR